MLYGVIYCCKASEALGLPLCIICVSITSSVVLILDDQKAACPKSTSFAQRHVEIGCCFVQAPSKGRVVRHTLKSIWDKQSSKCPKLR